MSDFEIEDPHPRVSEAAAYEYCQSEPRVAASIKKLTRRARPGHRKKNPAVSSTDTFNLSFLNFVRFELCKKFIDSFQMAEESTRERSREIQGEDNPPDHGIEDFEKVMSEFTPQFMAPSLRTITKRGSLGRSIIEYEDEFGHMDEESPNQQFNRGKQSLHQSINMSKAGIDDLSRQFSKSATIPGIAVAFSADEPLKTLGEPADTMGSSMSTISTSSDRRPSVGISSLSKLSRCTTRRNSYINCKNKPYKDTTVIPTDLFAFNITRMQRLVSEMMQCLQAIRCRASFQDLEEWACVIYESMSSPSRTFHSVQHVFDISSGADPISKLSAFFHDIVYYSIDGGLNDRQEELIGEMIEVKNEDGMEIIYITEQEFDENTNMVLDIFGFIPGQRLDPFKGMNEFLSALLAIRCYQNNLKNVHLAQVAACIEATIPFRKLNEEGKSPCDILFERLEIVNDKYNLGLKEEGLVETVQRAADLGNRDLENFSTPERAVFLSNTWNLLPESNINLRNTKVFRVSDYASALKKMTGFFEFLGPETIYLSFRDDEEQKALLKKKTMVASVNVKVATKYMYCKRLSIGVVAAISELSGGDAPLALFLGDLPEPHFVSTSIEDFIDVSEPQEGLFIDGCVFNLLRHGRESESKFDIKNSPLAAYLYSLIGDEGVGKCLVHAVHPMDKEHAKELLRSLPEIALATIVAACAEIATTREARLDQMMVDLVA